jgi:serine protease
MRTAVFALLALLCLAAATGPALSAADFRDPSRELLVLLARDLKPEEVLEAVHRGKALPAALGLGAPDQARWLIPEPDRHTSPNLDPDSPSGLLNRYIVLSYPTPVDTAALLRAMGRNRNILYAVDNRPLHASVLPNDPRFPPPPGSPTPDQYQWGSYSLHLQEAWDYNKGHSYVGVIDYGLAVQHPDLRTFHKDASGQWVFDHGNYRPQFAFDYGYPDEGPNCPGDPNPSPSCVDEGQPQLVGPTVRPVAYGAGHGSHVSGIIGATTNTAVPTDVAGACWNCSLIVSKFSALICSVNGCRPSTASRSAVTSALNGAIQKGAQVLNLSAGYRPTDVPPPPDCQASPLDPFCLALQQTQDRDVVFVAAAGNNLSAQPDFPASDARVIGVAGIDATGSFWNDCSPTSPECGSNYSPDMINAPAKQILSTFYPGIPYSITPGTTCAGNAEVGPCTGTSMASPYIAGSAGILRSVNPLLTRDNIKTLLTTNLENPPGWSSANGKGKPNLGAAVRAAQGTIHGTVIPNRLTPLFSLYGFATEDYFYTTVPQMVLPALYDSGYSSVGTPVPGYPSFPGASCQAGPCPNWDPGASVYIFTGDRIPYTTGTPTAPLLVPLYRLSFKGTNPNGNTNHRDATYTTQDSGVLAFKQVGYELDGIEGYIYSRCTPEPSCIPPGAVRLYRRYNPQRDDFAIFPESELSSMVSLGYTSTGDLNEVLGYAYPNFDTDGDNVIDGFERLLGTDPQRSDSDCDSVGDGVETLGFPAGDPLGSPGCFPPVARFTFACTGLACSFDGAASTDNAGITSYTWTFGDSTNAAGASTGHTFLAGGTYLVSLKVTDTDGLSSTLTRTVNVTSAAPAAAEGFFTVPLCRILDSRNTTILTSGQQRTIQITGACGIPASAKAVSVTIAVVAPNGQGYMTFLPGNLPAAPYAITPPSINFDIATSPRTNNAVLRLATNGAGTVIAQPSVFTPSGQVHLIVDVAGYFSEDAAPVPGAQGPFGFQTVTPCRLVDTRTSTPVTAGVPRSFTVQGLCGIPAGAAAAALNLTVVQPTSGGHMVLYPSDNNPAPVVAAINFPTGTGALANGARLRLAAATPDVSVIYAAGTAGSTAHVILDTAGYFKTGAPLKYHPITPCREADTRFADQGAPALTGGENRAFQIRGNCGVPTTAKAAVINLVAVAPAGPGFLTAYAAGTPYPGTATLNFDPSQGVLGNGAVVPLGTTANDLTITAGVSATHLILDVFGYFD